MASPHGGQPPHTPPPEPQPSADTPEIESVRALVERLMMPGSVPVLIGYGRLGDIKALLTAYDALRTELLQARSDARKRCGPFTPT